MSTEKCTFQKPLAASLSQAEHNLDALLGSFPSPLVSLEAEAADRGGVPHPTFYRKNIFATPSTPGQIQNAYAEAASVNGSGASNPVAISSAEPRRSSDVSTGGVEGGPHDGHVPHLICKVLKSPSHKERGQKKKRGGGVVHP